MMNIDNLPWCEKYRAKCFADVKGQELAIDKVKLFLKTFPKKKAIALHGPPGVGKTSLAYAIAFENDAEILELNASDFRNKAKINEIVGRRRGRRACLLRIKLFVIVELFLIKLKISNRILHVSIYNVSNFTSISKSSVDLPDTCANPVIPGFISNNFL